jgi:hypothetical protein
MVLMTQASVDIFKPLIENMQVIYYAYENTS